MVNVVVCSNHVQAFTSLAGVAECPSTIKGTWKPDAFNDTAQKLLLNFCSNVRRTGSMRHPFCVDAPSPLRQMDFQRRSSPRTRRMVYKHDLRACPIYHHVGESIDADLTIVCATRPSVTTKQVGA
jgi:hypothetical protein